MKKIKLVLVILVMFIGFISLNSCEKVESQNCNCGTIANDGIDISTSGNFNYWLEIRSECSGNKKKFYFDQDVWMNNHVGDNFCVTNQTGW